MNNSEFLDRYQQLQYTIMYDLLKNLGFGSLAVGSTYESAFFNHVQTKKILTDQNLKTLETELEKLDRKSAVYFEKSKDLEPNIKLLQENNYKKLWEDSWMFHNESDISSDFDNIELIEDESRLEVFLETFDKCYQKDDPQNPYGELGNYIDVARTVWNFHKGTNRLQYFLIKDEEGDYPNEFYKRIGFSTKFTAVGYVKV